MSLLLNNITEKIKLNSDELAMVQSTFEFSNVAKGEKLSTSDDQDSCLYFVETGMLRTYIKGRNERELIIQFASEGSWVPYTFNKKQNFTGNYYIEAIEDSRVQYINWSLFEALLIKVTMLETYARIVMQENLEHLQRRIAMQLISFAEDRYRMFVSCYADIAQRVPLYMIAAYLGLKSETLSRSRKKIATSKAQNYTFSSLANSIIASTQTSNK